MRKRIAVLLLLALLLTGCGEKKTDEQPEDLPGKTEEQTPDRPGALSFVAETTAFEGTKKAEDGTPLVTYAFQIPTLTVYQADGTQLVDAKNEKEQAALAAQEVFNAKFEEWTQTADIEGMTAAAKEHLDMMKEFGTEWVGGYVMELGCGIYQTERMVSVSGIYYSYTGGAHPNTYHMGWNFDVETGTFLDVKLLGEDDGLQEAVAAEILRQAKLPQDGGWVPAETYWENHESIIADWSSYAVCFHEKGMTVTFSAYELAPYAAGPQEFHFSYDWLEPHLNSQGKLLLGLEA